ncbi:ribonuclease R [bacterium]|nr:ribonuclease R [bacterium]
MRIKHSEAGFDETILRYMSVHVGRSYSARELAKKIQIKKRNFKVFRRILRNLAKQGILWESEEGIFQLPDSKKAFREKKKARQKPEHRPEKNRQGEELVEGTLKQYRGGFAFLIPKDREREDVFIPPDGLGGAIEGDHVLVRIVRPQGQKKAEGQVVKILDRRIQSIVGVFQTGKAYGKVIPWDRKIQIEPTVSTKNFAGATDGMMVEAELILDTNPPEAKIISLLGFQGEPDLDTKIIISRYHLPREFPQEVLEEAEKVAVIKEEDYKGRKDFRDWWTVTIDGQKARDFDDAISVTAFKNGGFLLGVHIADVANYVKEDSALDVEARERGNSVYFPELVIPMLPEKLSNEICSLNPQVDRLTMSVVARIDKDGKILDYHIYPSVIRSNERMTYSAVKQIVEDRDPELLHRYEPLVDMFFTMKKLALLLMRHRRDRGSIDFDLPEPEVIIDLTTGRMTGVVRSERNVAHRLIEEFMLLANEIVATHISNSQLPSVYRVHEPPPPEKIGDFATIAASLGYRLPVDAGKIKPKDLAKLLEKIEGKPEEKFLNVLLLRSMSRARYDLNNSGHFGLALSSYTHFTSPIRRYPDLMVHRALKTLLKGRKPELSRWQKMRSAIPEIAEHCSMTERRSDDAERDFIQLKKVEFMRDKLGEAFDGYITGVAPYGLFVELNEFFVEGLVPMKYMDDDRYAYDERRHIFKGKRTGQTYRLGDPIKVQVVRVDREKREIDFVLA